MQRVELIVGQEGSDHSHTVHASLNPVILQGHQRNKAHLPIDQSSNQTEAIVLGDIPDNDPQCLQTKYSMMTVPKQSLVKIAMDPFG